MSDLRDKMLARIYEVYGEPSEFNREGEVLLPNSARYIAVQRPWNGGGDSWYYTGDNYEDLLAFISSMDACEAIHYTPPVVFDLEDGSMDAAEIKYVTYFRSRDALDELSDGPIL